MFGIKKKRFIVKAKAKFMNVVDSEVSRVRSTNEQWEVSEERKDTLVNADLVEVVSEVKTEDTKEPEVKTAKRNTKSRKAIRKTTKVNE